MNVISRLIETPMVAVLSLCAAVTGWILWRHARRQGWKDLSFFAFLVGIALGFAIAFAAFHEGDSDDDEDDSSSLGAVQLASLQPTAAAAAKASGPTASGLK